MRDVWGSKRQGSTIAREADLVAYVHVAPKQRSEHQGIY